MTISHENNSQSNFIVPRDKHILIIESNYSKKAVSIKSSPFSVGRHPDNSLILLTQSISRHHANFLWIKSAEKVDEYAFWILDGNIQGQRSSNGIFVNGNRCIFQELKQGDVIVFGGTVKAWYHIISAATTQYDSRSHPPVKPPQKQTVVEPSTKEQISLEQPNKRTLVSSQSIRHSSQTLIMENPEDNL